jgi:nucleolar complex protein 3
LLIIREISIQFQRKKIKISSAKRGHHEKHKKNFAKTKKQTNKEKQLKENLFSGKKKALQGKIAKLQKPEKREKPKVVHEPVEEDDIDDRMDMLGSDEENNLENSVFENEEQYDSDVDAHEFEYQRMTQNEAAKYENTRELLPIKTKGGILPRSAPVQEAKKGKKVADQDEDEEMEESDVELETKQEIKESVSMAELLAQREEEIDRQKFFIGVTCAGILEKPEDKIKSLNNLIDMIPERTKAGVVNFLSVRKLAMISIVEVFKDIIPEYRVGIVDTDGQKRKEKDIK